MSENLRFTDTVKYLWYFFVFGTRKIWYFWYFSNLEESNTVLQEIYSRKKEFLNTFAADNLYCHDLTYSFYLSLNCMDIVLIICYILWYVREESSVKMMQKQQENCETHGQLTKEFCMKHSTRFT
jgi:hypothetical protein